MVSVERVQWVYEVARFKYRAIKSPLFRRVLGSASGPLELLEVHENHFFNFRDPICKKVQM